MPEILKDTVIEKGKEPILHTNSAMTRKTIPVFTPFLFVGISEIRL